MDSTRQRQLGRYQARLSVLAAKIADIGIICRGSIMAAYTTCATPNCRCRATPPQLHGPYWTYTRNIDGKTHTRRLTAGQAKLYKQWIANTRRLDRIIAQMEQVSRQAAELLLPEKTPRPRRRPTPPKP